MAEQLIPINIVIGDRSYRLKVPPREEELVRGTVKIINEKIIEFKTNFAGKDMQDYIAMVLVWYASQSATNPLPLLEADQAEQALAKLEQQIDDVLAL